MVRRKRRRRIYGSTASGLALLNTPEITLLRKICRIVKSDDNADGSVGMKADLNMKFSAHGGWNCKGRNKSFCGLLHKNMIYMHNPNRRIVKLTQDGRNNCIGLS